MPLTVFLLLSRIQYCVFLPVSVMALTLLTSAVQWFDGTPLHWICQCFAVVTFRLCIFGRNTVVTVFLLSVSHQEASLTFNMEYYV